jgi:nucleoside-diphosphate-sugar epimerase
MLKQGTRVLVTGGAGFIGAHLTRALVQAGCSVRVLDDLSTGRSDRLSGSGARLDLVDADIRDASSVARAARGAHAIVHLAGAPVGTDLGRAQEVNLGGAVNVLAAAREADKKERPRVILCGSGNVYGKQQAFVLHEELQPHPATAEAVMALAAEHYGRVHRDLYGLHVTMLRLFRTFGPDEDADRPDASVVARFIRAALDGTSPCIWGDGQQTRDLVYVENVVAALLAAVRSDSPEVLNIASGEAVAINFLWTLVLDLAGKRRRAIEPTYVPAPSWESQHARPQIARACKSLGWAPSVRLREGLSRTVQHYVAQRTHDPNAWFSPKPEPHLTVTRPPRPPPPRERRPVAPLPKDEVIELREIEAVDEPVRELDVEWAPVPSVPGLGRS